MNRVMEGRFEPAVLIARLTGPVLVAIALGILLNASFYVGAIIEAVHSPTLVYMSGIASLLAGLAILNAYAAWTSDWRIVVTIVGWIFTIAGVIRIVIPQLVTNIATKIYSGPTALSVTAIIVLVVGGFLAFKGYRQ
jgi:TM2 domain-containing membrane protein YozV